MTPELKVSRALTKLLFNHPFFGSIALSLKVERDDTQPTMCTNGRFIKWNGDFVAKMTEDEVLGVVVHEVYHVVMKHMLRRRNRPIARWNVACDYVINNMIKEASFTLPADGLHDTAYANLTAETAYDRLPPPEEGGGKGTGQGQGKGQGKGQGQGMPDWGTFEDATQDVGEEAQIEAEIDQKITVAANAAKNMGKLPAFVKGLMEEMEEAQVDWRDKVRRFLAGDQPDDYSMRKPNRKLYHVSGIVAPSIDRKGCGHMVVGVDSSGSVSDKVLKHFLGEINAISEELGPASITIITCDAKIHTVERFEMGDTITAMSTKGRGGTQVGPVFEYVEKQGLECDHLIYLTDLEVWDFPDHAPRYPVMWVAPFAPGRSAPFGEVTFIRVDE